jgi:hypothetical protein
MEIPWKAPQLAESIGKKPKNGSSKQKEKSANDQESNHHFSAGKGLDGAKLQLAFTFHLILTACLESVPEQGNFAFLIFYRAKRNPPHSQSSRASPIFG